MNNLLNKLGSGTNTRIQNATSSCNELPYRKNEFIDFNKELDSIYHVKIWKLLAKQGVGRKIKEVLEYTYKTSVAFIKLNRIGKKFKIIKGVKQRDPPPLSSIFSSVLREIFRNLEWEGRGIKIDGDWLNNRRFAHDVV